MAEYIVKVKSNQEYCGEGAGGAQFAHGEARVSDTWLAEWFRSHEGYEVENVETEAQETPETPAEEAQETEAPKAAKAAKSAAK